MKHIILEALLNKTLEFNLDKDAALARLANKTIRFTITPFGWIFCFHFSKDRVQVDTNKIADADLEMKGDALTFAKLQLLHDNRQMKHIEQHGDLHLAESLNRLLDRSHIDWEAALAELMGDTLAHQVCSLAKRSCAWQAETRTDLGKTVGEYLQHELQVSPSQLEADTFYKDVDEFRDAIERVAQKIS